jgi:hypothetical protein
MAARTIPLSVVAMLAGAAPVVAAPLSFVNVSAPAINCVFNVTCTVTVTDSVDTIVVPPLLWSGTGRLQSRTFTGAAGSPAAGKTGYEYRVDMSQAVSDGEVPCVTGIDVDFGPVTKLQYNKVGPVDDVFVVTKGGLGNVGLYAVEQNGSVVSFTFNEPVCAGTSPGKGDSSYFFGLTSVNPPKIIIAYANVPGLEPIDVKARAPGLPRPAVVGPLRPRAPVVQFR